MLARISAALIHLIGPDEASAEQRRFEATLSDLERRQLETEALTAELEARIAVLESGHADEHLA